MTWAKVDDKLYSSPKWLVTSKGGRALWVTALSWCMDHLTDGRVPSGALRALGATTRDASDLVKCGLWEADEDGGYVFHDWADYQPDAASISARRAAESEAGRRGNHLRWHVARRVRVAGCEWCRSDDRSGTRSPPRSGKGESGPESSRTRTYKESEYVSDTSVTREDETPPLETTVPRHKLLPGWGPSAEHHAAAAASALSLDREVTKFRAWARAKGHTSLDWDAEFTRWLVGSAERREERAGDTRQTSRTTDDRVRDGLELAARMRADEAANVIHLKPEIGA